MYWKVNDVDLNDIRYYKVSAIMKSSNPLQFCWIDEFKTWKGKKYMKIHINSSYIKHLISMSSDMEHNSNDMKFTWISVFNDILKNKTLSKVILCEMKKLVKEAK
jgi:hypothetical protein